MSKQDKVAELTAEVFGRLEGDIRRVVEEAMDSALTAVAEETTIAEALGEEDDGYLYFDGEDPRLPAGVEVEVRSGEMLPWNEEGYTGFFGGSAYPYIAGDCAYRLLRVKKSEIIDIGERAVGRLVEAWDDGEEPFIGLCVNYHSADTTPFYKADTTPFYKVVDLYGRRFHALHVRLINNAERE